ncbi:hypothetical protein I203_105746 [Kwoniella mangroviensis CBS 8507]|uniref:uncharacterized protein n=1 Tax=Kwoniella mangroviensis CBS 8507 TaxID=1296122 RepID=UPI00080D81EE|nr:uncharacterized protein I203_01558 [Kwoniella mangroviensis CBS 8507]OCF69694.1 hypothetical protein I203_01558 [Kwoniella mangroviensis CBS 8507]
MFTTSNTTFGPIPFHIFLKHAGPSTIQSRARTLTSTAKRSARTHGSLSHYDVLKLSKNSTKQQIKARFYELSKQYHPDAKGGDTAKFHEINDAYAVLGDDSKRRQYDTSLTPASHQSHPSRTHQPYGHGHGHSSFSPRDPYLHRAAQGPHRAWSNTNSTAYKTGQAPRTENYQPFGRKTPPNFQYTYEYDFNYNPNARTARPGGKRKAGEDGEGDGEGAGGGGVWKFLVTVGLIFTVISLGGGLTANSEGLYDWEIVRNRWEEELDDRLGLHDRDEVDD